MAKHLDLEEQEQLDEFKHFWKQYGDLITWTLIVVLAAVAAWNGYQYWQARQSSQASGLHDELERAAQAGDTARLDRSLADMKSKYGKTVYAEQSALLAAKTYFDKGNTDAARAALSWDASNATEEGYKAIARLRLAGLQLEAKSYAEATQTLSGPFPAEFEPLVADRLGDILLAQAKTGEAKTAYEKAWKTLPTRSEYRRLVAAKLNAMGVDPAATSVAAAPLIDPESAK